MQKSWKDVAYQLAPSSLPSLVSYTNQDILPKGGVPFHELGPPTSIINEGNVPQMCPQENLRDEFSQLRVLLPRYV